MKAAFDHLTVNVSDFQSSAAFYKDLLRHLQGEIIKEEKSHIGFRLAGGGEIWLTETNPDYKHFGFHRKRTGVNHLAFWVESPGEVDRFHQEYLKPRNVPSLYNSPAHFPYTAKYYAVYFEDPDRLKLEIVYRKASSSFSYRVAVPGEVDEKAEPEAVCKNGVMKVTFAKKPATQPKKITVKSE